MSKRTLFVLLAGICLLATGSVTYAADAAAPDCAVAPMSTDDAPVVQDSQDELSLEQLLETLTPEPETKAIDSGICCSSSSQCDSVSGYAHWCGGSGCWQTGGPTCLYRRL